MDQVGIYTNYYDAPNHAIAVTSDGGFVAVGYSSSSNNDIPGNYGSNDIVLIKADANGNRLWSKNFGGTGDDDGLVRNAHGMAPWIIQNG